MRDYRKLHEDVVFGRSNGKIIWQPRMDCWISDRIFADGKLPGIYEGMSKSDIYRELGCSARIYEYNESYTSSFVGGNIEQYHETVDNKTTRYIKTPKGTLTHITKTTPSSWASLVAKEWVTCEEDLKIMQYVEDHRQWGWNQEHFDKTEKEWGNLGAPCIFMPRVSMQNLFIDLMGVEESVYAVMDYPDAVDDYFKVLRESHFRMIDVINNSPINIIDFGDNIHSGTLSPQYFERYVLEEYQMRTERLHKGGKFVYSHYDGDNKGLMQYYHQTGLDGIEAITPLPQGDVTLEEVKQYLGDDMFLIDGIPAVYFDKEFSEEILSECVEKIIDLFAPNLVLGISDEISSTGDIERIRLVGKMVDKYNESLDNK